MSSPIGRLECKFCGKRLLHAGGCDRREHLEPGDCAAVIHNSADVEAKLAEVREFLDVAEAGGFATAGRDFGRGVAFLASELREVVGR